jgi:hypothetical protein
MHSKLLSVAFALFLVGCARIDSDEAREIAQQFLADKVPDATLLAYKDLSEARSLADRSNGHGGVAKKE